MKEEKLDFKSIQKLNKWLKHTLPECTRDMRLMTADNMVHHRAAVKFKLEDLEDISKEVLPLLYEYQLKLIKEYYKKDENIKDNEL